MFCKHVSIYVPGTSGVNGELSASERQKHIRKIAGAFSDHFGGATATNGTGFWKPESAGLVEESVTIVKSYYADDITDALDFARSLACQLRDDLGQEAVTIETQDGILFV